MATVMAELEAIVTADTSGFDSAMDASGAKVEQLGTKAQGASANFGAASAAMAAGAVGIGVGIADAIGMAGDFEASMNEIGAVTGATAEEMAQLSDVALQIGQDTAFSAQEGAAAITELGKAGIPIPDIMNGAAMATADLAAAGEVDMARAAEVMSNAMNTFGISGEKAVDVADTLAAGANTSASSVNDLAMGMTQAGPAAAGLGISLEETVATLAAFSDRGMQGSDAGTSLKTMLASLTPSTKKAREAFYELGLATDETANVFFDANGEFVGMEQAADLLYEALAPLTDEQRAVALETLFGSDASRAAAILFDTQADAAAGAGKSLGEYIDAVQPAGQATDVANARMAGMNGALEALSGSIDTAKIAFGMAFLPVVETVAEKLAELVNIFIGLPPELQTVISVVGAGAAAFLAVGSAIGFIIGPLGAFLGALAPVAAGIAAIAAPLALVVAGLAALYVAYQTNFLGFADGVNAAAGNIIALVQNMAAAFGEGGLSGALAVLGDAFLLAFSNISSMVQTKLQEVSDAILAWVGTVPALLDGAWATIQAGAAVAWEAIVAAISSAWDTITGTVSAALATVQQTVSDAWVAVETSIAGTLETTKATVLAAWTAIQETVALTMQTVTQTVSDTWNGIQATLSGILATIQTTVSDAWTGMQTTIAGILATIQTTVSTAWEAIQTTVTTVLQAIQDATGVQFETMGTVISGAMETIQATISSAWQTISSTVTTTLQTITSAVSAQFEAIKTTITTAATEAKDGFISTLTSMASEAVTAVTGLKDQIVGVFAGARDWLFQAGADLIGGLVDGILSMAGSVGDAVASVVPDSIGMPTLDFAAPVGNAINGGGGGGGSNEPSSTRSGTGQRRAAGGPVRADLAYWVGEQGAEPFFPATNGRILSHDDAMDALGGRGGTSITIQSLNLPGVRDPQDFVDAMRDLVRSGGVAAGRGVS
jgi:TP901 family phage tail tape measure protein